MFSKEKSHSRYSRDTLTTAATLFRSWEPFASHRSVTPCASSQSTMRAAPRSSNWFPLAGSHISYRSYTFLWSMIEIDDDDHDHGDHHGDVVVLKPVGWCFGDGLKLRNCTRQVLVAHNILSSSSHEGLGCNHFRRTAKSLFGCREVTESLRFALERIVGHERARNMFGSQIWIRKSLQGSHQNRTHTMTNCKNSSIGIGQFPMLSLDASHPDRLFCSSSHEHSIASGWPPLRAKFS